MGCPSLCVGRFAGPGLGALGPVGAPLPPFGAADCCEPLASLSPEPQPTRTAPTAPTNVRRVVTPRATLPETTLPGVELLGLFMGPPGRAHQSGTPTSMSSARGERKRHPAGWALACSPVRPMLPLATVRRLLELRGGTYDLGRMDRNGGLRCSNVACPRAAL